MSDRDKERKIAEAYQKGLGGESVGDGFFRSPTHEEKTANRRGLEEKNRLDEVQRRREEVRNKRRAERVEAQELRQAERQEERRRRRDKISTDKFFDRWGRFMDKAEKLARVNPLPLEMIRSHKTGEVHQLYHGSYCGWASHPDGILIAQVTQRYKSILDYGTNFGVGFWLNGRIDYGHFGCRSYKVHHDSGVVAGREPQLNINLLNCPTVTTDTHVHGLMDIYAGPITDFWAHPQGAVVKIGDRLLLNGEVELFRGHYDEIKYHPLGIAIRVGDKILLDGQHLLYQGPMESWLGHNQGVIILRGDDLLLNGEASLTYGLTGWKRWASHPSGVITQHENRLVLNGDKIIFEGDFEEWGYHPRGTVVRIEDSFLLV